MSNKNLPPSQFKPLVEYAQELPAPSSLHRRLGAELAPSPPASGAARQDWLIILLVGLVGILLATGLIALGRIFQQQFATFGGQLNALGTQSAIVAAEVATLSSLPTAIPATATPIPTEVPTNEPAPTQPITITAALTFTTPITFVYALISPTIPLVTFQVIPSSVLEDPLQQTRITLLLDSKPADHLFRISWETRISDTVDVWPIPGVLTDTSPLTRTLQVAVDGKAQQDLIQLHLLPYLEANIQSRTPALRPYRDRECTKADEPQGTDKGKPVQVLGKIKAWSFNGSWSEVDGVLISTDSSSVDLRCLDVIAFGTRGLTSIFDAKTTFLPDFSVDEIKKLLPNETSPE